MKILFVSSECAPYAKTGGLADVVSALPLQLKNRGHDVRIVIPRYERLNLSSMEIREFLNPMGVWMGNEEHWCSVDSGLHGGIVPIYFIHYDAYFKRPGLYHDDRMEDYHDNPRRFAFLSRAALQLCIDMDFSPDIVHIHDWQTALAASYIKRWHWDTPQLKNTASVLTIHNLAYQGVYRKEDYDYLALGWENFHEQAFESWDRVNFLKGGIYFADAVNTVSPTYADETRDPSLGKGLAPYLNNKGDNYRGILNGVDYDEWNPQTDPYIAAQFSPGDMSGKALCKKALQEEFHLEQAEDVPIIGVVSRFVSQKGLHHLAGEIEQICAQMRVQFALLGSGEKYLEDYFGGLPARYGGIIGSYIGYDNRLSHVIEAGADLFCMPSEFEPCGLNQIYSMKYGTLPIVRATGGLEDTVDNYDEASGRGTGFKFNDASGKALANTIGWAVSTWYDRRDHFRAMQLEAMSRDFSWERSAGEYEDLYRTAMQNRRNYDSWYA
jgi:starch synthase